MSDIPDSIRRRRSGWRWDGSERPDFADEPGPGEESVWDYPRPPRLEEDDREVVVRHGELVVARTRHALRVLETASPPTFYLPPDDVRTDLLDGASGSSTCEWKGNARYWSLRTPDGEILERVAWSYPDPYPGFEELRDHLAFYPDRLESRVDGRRVQAQPGGFYGGWVTPEIVGPVKGEPGTGHW